jgi:hypothetical protein
MKERAKALLSKNKNELPAARTLYVSLDRADNVIEGGPAFDLEFVGRVAQPLLLFWVAPSLTIFKGEAFRSFRWIALWAPAWLGVILSEAKNLSVVLRMAMTVTERFFASLRMTQGWA